MNLFAHGSPLLAVVKTLDGTSTFPQESIARQRIAIDGSELVVLHLTKETCASLIGRALRSRTPIEWSACGNREERQHEVH